MAESYGDKITILRNHLLSKEFEKAKELMDEVNLRDEGEDSISKSFEFDLLDLIYYVQTANSSDLIQKKIEGLNRKYHEISDKEHVFEVDNEKLDRLLAQVSTLETEKNSVVEEKEKLLVTISNLEDQLKTKREESRLEDLEEISKLRYQLKELRSVSDKQSFELENKLNELHNMKEKLQQAPTGGDSTRMNQLSDEITKKDERIENLEKQLEERKLNSDAINQLKERIHILEKDLLVKEQEGKTLKEKLEELEITNSNLTKKLNSGDNVRIFTDPVEEKTINAPIVGVNQNRRTSNPLLAGASIVKANIVADQGLEDLLGSDIVIESVYDRMKTAKRAKIKILAMQLGINQQKCEEAIAKLVQIEVLKYTSEDNIEFTG